MGKIIFISLILIGCSTQHKVTKNYDTYTLDGLGVKVEYNIDSILKNIYKWGTISHYNIDSLNKIYNLSTVLFHNTLFAPDIKYEKELK